MARRKTVNRNGISRIQIEGSFKDAYVSYVCVRCGKPNFVNIGQTLISSEDFDDCIWVCEHCGFIHAVDSPLPSTWVNWQPEYIEEDTPTANAFWTAFFRQATLHPEYYWKKMQCLRQNITLGRFCETHRLGSIGKANGMQKL